MAVSVLIKTRPGQFDSQAVLRFAELGEGPSDLVLPVAVFTFDAVLVREITDAVKTTKHPIESGALITDHTIQMPTMCRMTGIISEVAIPSSIASKAAFGAVIASAFVTGGGAFDTVLTAAAVVGSLNAGANLADRGISTRVYEELLQAKQLSYPVDVYTLERDYEDYIIEQVKITRTAGNGGALQFDLVFSQLQVVDTQIVAGETRPVDDTRGKRKNKGRKNKKVQGPETFIHAASEALLGAF